MGVKHFFGWFRRQFADEVTTHVDRGSSTIPQSISTLLLDLNGIFHTKAAEVYGYGPNKRPTSLLRRPMAPPQPSLKLQIRLFSEICKTITHIVNTVNPRDKVILCIDGVAPQSKQSQQRSRRFRAAMEREEEDFKRFDSNCITPGTKFLDHLSKYIDWWLRQMVSKEWAHLDVIFSNEKVPGEGEHKLITYLRQYARPEESYCVYGVDADLIMLTLGTMLPNFYLIRENMYGRGNEYYMVDIGRTRDKLVEMMRWSSNLDHFDYQQCIYDFIFLCFMTGNDFLPHVPSIEIMEGGIETMITAYQAIGAECGHMTECRDGSIYFRPEALTKFFEYITEKEAEILENKLNKKESFYPDELLNACSMLDAPSGKFKVNFKKYFKSWTLDKFGEETEKACHDYFDGLHWVINYYIYGVPTWTWLYPHHYVPFARTLLRHLGSYRFKEFVKTGPNPPFLQLLSVLPPKSSSLLPEPLSSILTDKSLEVAQYFPEEIEIDLTGRMKEWEGIVIIPFLDVEALRKLYFERVRGVDQAELRRNVVGQNTTYRHGRGSLFKSFYGDVEVLCTTGTIDM